VRSGLANTSDQTRAVDDDHAGSHAVVSVAGELRGAAERVGPAPDHCSDNGLVTKRSLEFERFAKLLVVVGGGVELSELSPQRLVFRSQPLVLGTQAADVAEDRGCASGGRGERRHLSFER